RSFPSTPSSRATKASTLPSSRSISGDVGIWSSLAGLDGEPSAGLGALRGSNASSFRRDSRAAAGLFRADLANRDVAAMSAHLHSGEADAHLERHLVERKPLDPVQDDDLALLGREPCEQRPDVAAGVRGVTHPRPRMKLFQ